MPAGKRTRVPASLHNELTEYSSLLRALRTSNTLDLASQLTAHASAASGSRLDEDEDHVDPIDDDDADGEGGRPPADSIAPSFVSEERSEASGVTSSRRGASKATTRSTQIRDTWTRWPLLAGDVHAPEWSLEDEVKSMAMQTLNAGQFEEHTAPDSLSVDQSSDFEDTAESQLTPHALNAITESTGRHLAQILALLAAYIPPAEKSMQNRVRPLNWESVLSIAVANGLVTPDAFESLRQRLSAIYPQSSNTVVHNYPKPADRRVEDMNFLSIDGYDPGIPLPRLDGESFESCRLQSSDLALADSVAYKRRSSGRASSTSAKKRKTT